MPAVLPARHFFKIAVGICLVQRLLCARMTRYILAYQRLQHLRGGTAFACRRLLEAGA